MRNPLNHYTRRGFLGGTAAAAGAFQLVQPGTAFSYQANSKVSVGLIGTGNRGSYDAKITHTDPRAQVTALCDLFDDRIEKAVGTIGIQGKPAVYHDFEKVLAAKDIDAVIIATPPFEHPRMLEAAILAKKHVYCEKPMGVDAAGCKRVIEASYKADPTKCVSAGFQQRYGPVYLEAYKRLQAGELGDISVARAFWIGGDPFKRVPYPDPKIEHLRNWFCYRDYSGDFIVEQDCHNFDVLHWFLGGLPIRAVGMGGTKVRTGMEIMDRLSIVYEWPNGIQVSFEANQLTPPGFSHVGEEFTGTKSTIATSRAQMLHYRALGKTDRMASPRDITFDAIEAFLNRIVTNTPENVAERSALSTMIALLGRAAVYGQRETTWKGEFWS